MKMDGGRGLRWNLREHNRSEFIIEAETLKRRRLNDTNMKNMKKIIVLFMLVRNDQLMLQQT